MKGAASDRLTPIKLDVTDSESIRRAADQVQAELGGERLSGLVNNAGIAVSGPIEFLPIEEVRKQLEVNFIGQVAVTQAFLPRLRRDHGRVVNIGSVGGEVALPFLSPYAASKHAMEGFTDSLRREVEPLGVHVAVVRPGAIQSSIWERGNAAADEILEGLPPEAMQVYGERSAAPGPPEPARARGDPRRGGGGLGGACADGAQTEDALRDRRAGKAMITLERWLPDRVFDRLVARAMRGLAAHPRQQVGSCPVRSMPRGRRCQ